MSCDFTNLLENLPISPVWHQNIHLLVELLAVLHISDCTVSCPDMLCTHREALLPLIETHGYCHVIRKCLGTVCVMCVWLSTCLFQTGLQGITPHTKKMYATLSAVTGPSIPPAPAHTHTFPLSSLFPQARWIVLSVLGKTELEFWLLLTISPLWVTEPVQRRGRHPTSAALYEQEGPRHMWAETNNTHVPVMHDGPNRPSVLSILSLAKKTLI